MQYQCARTCGYALMNSDVQLGRCVVGRRVADESNLVVAQCNVVTTAALRRGDRLRLQDIVVAEPTDPVRYVLVAATPSETAASNFWGVVKLADLD